MSTVPSPLAQGYSDTSLPIIDPAVPVIGNASQIAAGGGKRVITDEEGARGVMVATALGRGQLYPNLFSNARGQTGKFVQADGNLGTNAGFAATDQMPVVGGASYIFSRRPQHLAFYDAAGAFIPDSYSTPATGGVFEGTISGDQLTIASVIAGSLAVGTPVDTVKGTPGGVEILAQTSGTAGGAGVYTLNKPFVYPVTGNGTTIYGGHKVTAPNAAVGMQASMENTSPVFGFVRWGIYPGTALPSVATEGGSADPASARRAAMLQLRLTVPKNSQLFNRDDPETYTDKYWGNYQLLDAAGFFATHRIPVIPGETYIADKSSSGVQQGQMWDDRGGGASTFQVTANSAFVIPEGIWEIAFSGSATDFLDLKLVRGTTVPAGALPFLSPQANKVRIDALTTRVSAAEASLTASNDLLNRRPARLNLFDKRTVVDNMALSEGNGAAYEEPNRFYSAIMPVTPGVAIYISTHGSTDGAVRLVWRRADGSFLSSPNQVSNEASYTPPTDAYGLQVDCPHYRWKDALMVSVGSTRPAGYRPFVTSGDRPKQDAQMVLLGDSFTSLAGTAGGWVPYFVGLTGVTITQNYAVDGRPTRDALKDTSGVVLTSAAFASATDVLIPIGTNDYGSSRPLGTIADADVGYSGSGSFCNDVFAVLNTLYGWNPALRIVWATPTIRGVVTGQPTYPAANSAGVTLTQYRDAILEVCGLFGTPVIDMFRVSGFNLANLATMTDDGLHPNDLYGRPRYGRAMAGRWNAA